MATPLSELDKRTQQRIRAELAEAERSGRAPGKWRYYAPTGCSSPLVALRSRAYYEWQLRRRRLRKRTKRERIVARDGMVCGICGEPIASWAVLEIDHIIPVAKGGTSEADNLQTAHKACNRSKGAR